jgi:hypothetical protein
MRLEPVELADEARVGPKAIDLEAFLADGKPRVQAGSRDVVGIEEGKEELLEGAADAAAGVIFQAFEAPGDSRGTSMVRVAVEEHRNRDRAVDPEVFHLPEGALRGRLAFVDGEVEQGAGR